MVPKPFCAFRHILGLSVVVAQACLNLGSHITTTDLFPPDKVMKYFLASDDPYQYAIRRKFQPVLRSKATFRGFYQPTPVLAFSCSHKSLTKFNEQGHANVSEVA